MSAHLASTSPPLISVFGGARAEEHSPAYQEARSLGAALAGAGFAVVTGGYGGVMEAVSRGAAEAGGQVVGIVARALAGKANRWVTRRIVVETWAQRLFELVMRGDGYVACPGATGTLVELAVAWEMMSKGLLPRRPLVALGAYWRPIVEHIQAAERNTGGFVSLADSVPAALETLQKELPGRRAARISHGPG